VVEPVVANGDSIPHITSQSSVWSSVHQREVSSLFVASSEHVTLVESSARSVLIRDAISREIVDRFALRSAVAYGAAVSPDGRWLCLALAEHGGNPGTQLQIWDLAARRMTAQHHVTHGIKVFASASACMINDRTGPDRAVLHRYSIPDATPIGDLETPYADLEWTDALAFSADGKWAIAARTLANGSSPQVVVFSASDWTPRGWLPARCARFDAAGTLLWNPGVSAAAAYDASLQRVGLASRSEPTACTPRVQGVRAQVVDGSELVVREPEEASRSYPAPTLSPDGRVAVFVDRTGVFLWTDAPRGQVHRIDLPASEIARDVELSADGAQLLVISDRGILRTFRVADRALLSTATVEVPAGTGTVLHWALYPLRDGRMIVRGNSLTRDFRAIGTAKTMSAPIPVPLGDDLGYFASTAGGGLLGVGLYSGLWQLDSALRAVRKDGLPAGRPRASIGLDLTADGRRAAVYVATGKHEGLHVIDSSRVKREARISLGDTILGGARDVRWNRAADRVWISDSEMLAIVDVATREVRVTNLWTSGEEANPRPDAGFVALAPYDDLGLRIVRADGSVALTFGIHDGGRYSYTPDGRFTCDGNGCNVLRCSIGTRAAPATSPACGKLRDESLELKTELQRASGIAPGAHVQLL
jgi:hypothetical protein